MNNMKNFKFGLLIGIASVFLLSCNNSKNVTAEEIAEEEQWENLIDPELKELGRINLILLKYDEFYSKVGDYMAVRSNKKWGIINTKGDTIIGFKYDEISKVDNRYWKLLTKTKSGDKSTGLTDIKGNIVIPPIDKCYGIEPIGEGLFVAKGRWGDWPKLYNEHGEEVVIDGGDDYDFQLFGLEKYDDTTCMVANGSDYWFRMSFKNGECSMDSICYYGVAGDNGICYVKNEEGKWGAIDTKGNLIVPYSYNDINKRGKRVYVQNEEGKWGVDRGDCKSDFHDSYSYPCEDYYLLLDGNTKFIIDKQCKEIVRTEDQMDFVRYIDNGCLFTHNHIFDKSGHVVASVNDSLLIIDNFFNNYIVVRSKSGYKFGVLDKNGKIIVPIDSIVPNIYGENKIIFRRCIKDEFVNGERVVEWTSEIFNTENGEYTKPNLYLKGRIKEDGLIIAEIDKKNILVTEDGKTGLLNINNVLEAIKEEKEKNKQNEQKGLEESIKEQLVEMINKNNHRKILDSPSDLENFAKDSEGNYKARFTIYGEYEHFTHDVLNIKVDEDGKVLSFDVQLFRITPTDKKPDGTADPNEIMRRKIQGLQY